MRGTRVEAPKVSARLFRLFCGYLDWYLRRNFHAVRVAGSVLSRVPQDLPLIVCLNHPSWWDPLIALTLAYRLFPDRTHFGPIESHALAKYRFFEKIGFFGIEPGTAAGAATFLRTGSAILGISSSALWITAQGHFFDPRVRPLELRAGIGHLVRRVSNVIVLPVAIEYPYWEERFPEALIRFGEPIPVAEGSAFSADHWTATIAGSLERAQDRLAEDSMSRQRDAFEVLISGHGGIGIYDLWRSVRFAVRGQRFDRAHGSERL